MGAEIEGGGEGEILTPLLAARWPLPPVSVYLGKETEKRRNIMTKLFLFPSLLPHKPPSPPHCRLLCESILPLDSNMLYFPFWTSHYFLPLFDFEMSSSSLTCSNTTIIISISNSDLFRTADKYQIIYVTSPLGHEIAFCD